MNRVVRLLLHCSFNLSLAAMAYGQTPEKPAELNAQAIETQRATVKGSPELSEPERPG